MSSDRILRTSLLLLVLLLNLGCDQISKNLVRNKLQFHEQIKFFDNRVMLTRVENPGAFLSLGESLSGGIRFFALIFIPFMALMVGMYFLLVKSHLPKSTLIALSFIIGGGFGNIYDRYFYGAVTDFMHVDFILFRTGIFNMADVSIMIGAFIIILSSLSRYQNITFDPEIRD